MTPFTGARFGIYEIGSALGAGGMGEVYRARDTRLGRDVAIKLLPESFQSDAERLARFQREARSLAALNHPNIAAIYGIEEQRGVTALILELVEGDTLADRIRRGKLPVNDALNLALQIVDALEAAHERGIIHRDLKPSNIMVTPAAVAKLLDFGLAKAVEAGTGADLSRAATAIEVSRADVVVGTAPYMSPEQARGLAVDKRTDIWAFGCVLFEMLSGRTAFSGDTAVDVIISVLERFPDWTLLSRSTPAAAERLIRHCLEKDVKRRLRDIADARFDLHEALDPPSGPIRPAPPFASRHEVAFQRLTDFTGMKETAAVSPDGKMVAFVALVDGRRHIWVRLVGGGAPLQITHGDADHEQPRWAPDSSTLIYYTRATTPGGQGTIWEISALGGAPRRVASSIGGGDISHDGRRIAFFQASAKSIELVAVARDGSKKDRVADLPPEYLYTVPRWSPDDCSIGFQSSGIEFDHRLEVVRLDGGERRAITRSAWLKGFAWLPDGSGVVYSSSAGSTLLYPPVFNLRTIGCDGTGDAQLTVGDVSFWEPDLHQPSGKLLASRVRSQSDIWRFPVGGSPIENTRGATRVTRQTGHVQTPSVSPDGSEIVYLSDHGGHGNLWVARIDGSGLRQITFERDSGVVVGVPMWSPAGDWIVFIVTDAGQTGLWLVRPDGSDPHPLVRSGFSACWSRDGHWVYYTRRVIGSGRHEKISVEGGEPIHVRDEMGAAAVSADEETIYYAVRLKSDRLGQWSGDCEIRRVRMGDESTEVLTRIAGTRIPVSPLILQMFLSPDDEWLAVPLVDGATANIWGLPAAGGPMRQLTDFDDRSILIGRSVSWAGDGQSVYAAVAETETDIVSFDGLIG